MGLAQKRVIATFKDEKFPEWKKSFDQLTGCKIPVEMDWESMVRDTHEDISQYEKYWFAVYFDNLTTIFKDLCSDDMGRHAVKKMVKKIVVSGKEGTSSASSSFENGVLTYSHEPFNNYNGLDEVAHDIRKMIEAKL